MSAGQIIAGQSFLEVAVKDRTSEQLGAVQAKLTAFSRTIKATTAGLSAVTMPTLAADSSDFGKAFAARAGQMQKAFSAGLRSPKEFTVELDKMQRSMLATAGPSQALAVQFARLDADLKRGAISEREYQTQLTALSREFNASAGPIDRLKGQIVALDRDLQAGAITESEYRTQLAAVHREFTAAAGPADRYEAEIATLDAQLKQGKITQDQYSDAVRRAKTALDQADTGAAKSQGVFSSLGSQIATLAAGYVSWNTILQLTGEAMQFVREETEKAKQSQDSLVDSRRRLAQVASTEQDLAAMLERADAAAIKYGVDRKAAQEVMFQARSEGFEKDFEKVLQNATVVNPQAAAGVAGQVPGLFRQTQEVSTEQAITGTLAAAQQSRLDFEGIARALPQAAEGVSQAKGTFEETAAALGVLAGRFKSGDTAAERIKLFSAKLAQTTDTAGLGLIGGFDALVAAGAEAQEEFLGQSTELRAAFTILSEEMPTIRAQTAALEKELAAVGRGEESMLARQRRIAEADPGEQARLARVRAAINRERENEKQFAASGSARQAAIDKEMAALKVANQSGVVQFGAEKAGRAAEAMGLGESLAAGMTQAGAAFAAAITGQSQAYQVGQVAEAQQRAAEAGQTPATATPASAPVTQPPAVADVLATRAIDRATRGYAVDFAAAMDSAAADLDRRAIAEAELADAAQGYADQFAEQMENANERTQRAIEADEAQAAETDQYAADFATAMENASEATGRRIAEQAPVATPRESVAGTFSSWRMTGQFGGGVEQTAKEQLAEQKKNTRIMERLATVADRIEQKKLVYGG